MPYIRTMMMEKIKKGLFIFIFLSIAIAAVILLPVFRSFKVVATSLIVVAISIIWAWDYWPCSVLR
jgi:predicted RND superfamily exporter protein